MKYPDFFNNIETIKLQDSLSNFLNTFENGIVEFSYLDVVKAAGHSCPTVAGAYIMTLVALKNLYKDEIPKRGEILISFKDDLTDGNVGVISNVITQITGATQNNGFKGINGKFQRTELLSFNNSIDSFVKFQRIDNNKSIQITYNPDIVPFDSKVNILMKKIFSNEATIEDKIMFGKLWQERVEKIFNNIDKVLDIFDLDHS